MNPTIDRAKIHLTMNVDAQGNPSGGGGGGGDASAANQVTGNNSLSSIDGKLTITNTELGATNESAATGDTSTSGLNGLFKRLLQRVTVFITNLGDVADAAWTTGNGSAISLLKAIAAKTIDTAPVEVTSPAPTTVSGSISNGASLSAGIAIRGALSSVLLPSAWTTASITFQGSVDGGTTYADIYDAGTERTIASANVVGGRLLALSLNEWIGFTHIKIRSGTSATPVNQGAARTFALGLAG